MAKVLSIELGQSIVRICEVDYKSKKPKMYQNVETIIPDGTVGDGFINDPVRLGEAIKEALLQKKFSANKVVFTIVSGKIASREALLPFVKENKLNEVVQASAGDYFPVDISQSKIAYQVLGTQEKEGKKQYRVMVIAVPNQLLESYYDLAKVCGWEIVALDYVANSVHMAVKGSLSDGVQMIIKLDEKATQLFIYSDGEYVLQRSVPYGGDLAIDELIDYEKKQGNALSYEEALYSLRSELFISHNEGLAGTEGSEVSQVNESDARQQAVTGEMAVLAGAIYRVIDYYNSRNAGKGINTIFLTGSAGNFLGMAEYLGQELGIPVYNFNEYLKENGKAAHSEGSHVACIGAAMAPLDLIPDAHLSKKQKREQGAKQGGAGAKTDPLLIGILVFVLCVLASVVLVLMSALPYSQAKKVNKQLMQREAELAPIENVYRESVHSEVMLEEAKKIHFASRTPNENMTLFLNELEQILPSDVNVLSFSAGKERVSINMSVGSKEAVAQTMMEFRKLSSLSSVTTTTLSEEVDELGAVNVLFTIEAVYAPLLMETEEEEQQ